MVAARSSQSTADTETPLERLALAATHRIGSLPSLLIHTCFFVGIFALQWIGFGFDQIMLILTTVVSLEAIYLSIFIQMTVNHQAKQLADVSEDVEDISEDVEEISKDVEEIQGDVEEIQESVEDISEDVDEIGEDMEKDDALEAKQRRDIEKVHHIENLLQQLLAEIRELDERKK